MSSKLSTLLFFVFLSLCCTCNISCLLYAHRSHTPPRSLIILNFIARIVWALSRGRPTLYLIPALFLLAQARLHVFLLARASMGLLHTKHDFSFLLATPSQPLLHYTLPLLCSIST